MRLDRPLAIRVAPLVGILVLCALILSYLAINRKSVESRDLITDQDMVYLGACMDEDRDEVLGRLNGADVYAEGFSTTGATSVLVPHWDVAQAREAIETDPNRSQYDFTFGE